MFKTRNRSGHERESFAAVFFLIIGAVCRVLILIFASLPINQGRVISIRYSGGQDKMIVIASLLLWIAAIFFHTIVYNRRAEHRVNTTPSLCGVVCSGIAGGLLTYAIRPRGTVSGAYAYYVNGSRVSSGGMVGMQAIMVWVVFTAVFNLSAMGLGYLISKKIIKR